MAKQAQNEHEQDVSVEAGKLVEETVLGSGPWMVTLKPERQVLVVEVVDALHLAWEERTAVFGRLLLSDIWALWRRLDVWRYGVDDAGLRPDRCDDHS